MFVKLAIKRGYTLLAAPLALAAAVSNVAYGEEIKVKIPDTTLTASLRSSFAYTDKDSGTVADFALNSFDIYINSKITDKIKFSFSSEFGGQLDNDVMVQDAIAQFEFDPRFNIWAGRFLAPTDRANSYGAYFSNNWNFATDGTQDGYPFIAFGRSDGVAYWGDFAEKVKVSAGLFDVPSTIGLNDTMAAARVQINLWDFEPGYYVNGTYYGEKDILSFAVAANAVDSKTTTNFDFLMEKKIAGGGAFTVEGEYIKYDDLGGYPAPTAGTSSNGDSYYLMTSFLFPAAMGPGKLQLLGKFGTTTYEGIAGSSDIEQDTAEFNVNYIIKSFNARLSLFVLDKSYSDASVEDTTTAGLGVQLMTL